MDGGCVTRISAGEEEEEEVGEELDMRVLSLSLSFSLYLLSALFSEEISPQSRNCFSCF